MSNTKFQTESVSRAESTLLSRFAHTGWHDNDQSQTAIQSLLLGLHLRGWIAEGDANFLDLLVPPSASLFMLLGDRMLYLQDPEQPLSDTDPTTLAGTTEAIFTCRCQLKENGIGRRHTASIGRVGEQSLVLGLLEPEGAAEQTAQDDRFGALVTRFRKAMTSVAAIERQLSTRFTPDSAGMLVNRTSGRIMAVGDKLCELLPMSAESMVGREYTSLSSQMRPLVSRRGLNLENLSIDDMHFTIISVLPERPGMPDTDSDNFFAEFFIHGMRNKLSAILTASSHLESMARSGGQSDWAELAAIIEDQATELNRQIERLRLVTNYGRLPKNTVSVVNEIRSAIDLTTRSSGCQIQLKTSSWGEEPTCVVAHPALGILFEAALLSHLEKARSKINVTVDFDDQSSDVIAILRSQVAPGKELTSPGHWVTFTKLMAEAMGFEFRQELPDRHTLITTITVTVPRKEKQINNA